MTKLIFEQSVPHRRGVEPPPCDVPTTHSLPQEYLRPQLAEMPEVSELEVVRHFVNLSRKNFSVDSHFYPLGSCTMKYNPKVCERAAALPGFADLHPLLPQLLHGGMLTQGALQVLYETQALLSEICGMTEFTLQPLAGAHGELTGTMIMAAYHRAHNNHKTKVIIPDSAHGTNPASAAIAGFDVVSVDTHATGILQPDDLASVLDEQVAGVMLTCPNTLGLFNPHVKQLAEMVHAVDGLMYYDGANLNAILGRYRPGDLGFDVVHVNLHKTFATPHGCGGPGSGPVGVVEKLQPFLPTSVVVKRSDGTFALDYERPESVGYVAPFYGNFGVILRAFLYILMQGAEGLKAVSGDAVLSARYLAHRLKNHYLIPYDAPCLHECVLSANHQKESGATALDIAKLLLDRGFHAPTVYFPLTVPESMMIEPTETESKQSLDAFADTMIELAELIKSGHIDPQLAPTTTPVGRLDETKAARQLHLSV